MSAAKPVFARVCIRACEGLRELEVKIVHALLKIEAVGPCAQLIAGNLYLRAALFSCQVAGPGKQEPAQAPAPAGGRNGKFHDLGNAPGMVELVFQAQVQDTGKLRLPVRLLAGLAGLWLVQLADKAAVVLILKLPGKDFGKGLPGQLLLFHVADESIHLAFVGLRGLAKQQPVCPMLLSVLLSVLLPVFLLIHLLMLH